MANPDQARKTGRLFELRALGCLILAGTCLALSLIVAKLADSAGAPRLTFLMSAMAGAGVILAALSMLRNQVMRPNPRVLEYALVAGVLLALPNALGFLAVRHVGAGFVTLSFAFPILLTWVLAVLLGLERLGIPRLTGVLLALAGGVVLAGARAGTGDGDALWVALIVGIPLLIALGNIYRTLRWPTGAAPVFLAAVMMLGAALALLPFALALESEQVGALIGSATVATLLLAEIAVFTVLYLFYFVLQRLAGPVYLSQIGIVAAIIGTVIAVLALNEPTPPNLGMAAVLIIAGTVLFHQRSGAPAGARAPRRD